ncbi:MAG: hypothetical protein AAGE52_31055 [Myxococcota bacterium]
MTRKLFAILLVAMGCSSSPNPVDEPLPEGVRVDVADPIVLQEDVVVVSDDANLLDVTALDDGFLQFLYSARPQESFDIGNVIVGNEGPGYMGRVAEVREVSNTELHVRIDPVGLDEVIDEGAFNVRILPNAADFVTVMDGVGGRSSAIGGSATLVPREVLNGAGTCEGAVEGSISFTHEFETTDIDTEMIFDRRGLFGIQRAGMVATGGASVRLTVNTEGMVNADCLLDVLELLRVNPVEWTGRFRIGPIPVNVRIRLRPELTTNANVNMEPTRVETTLFASAELRLGAVYDRDSGIQPVAELDRDVRVDMDLEEGGEVSASLGVRAGLYLTVDVSGLELPRAGAELNAEASISTETLACTWNWEASVAGEAYLRGPLGVDLSFFSRTFTTFDESIGFSREVGGQSNERLPYCEADACDEENPCIGADEECVDGVCVEMQCGDDNPCEGEGEICVAGVCVPDLSMIVDCDACNVAGFDWCGDSESCGDPECTGDLRTTRSSCIPCDYDNCTDCANDGFCSWDLGEGTCVNDRVFDGDRGGLATNAGQCR